MDILNKKEEKKKLFENSLRIQIYTKESHVTTNS